MIEPSVCADVIPSWSAMTRELSGVQVAGEDTLIYCGPGGRILGVLRLQRSWHRTGFLIRVHQRHQRHQRKGIATALLRDALQRWPDINLRRERYTEAGAAWVNAYIRDARGDSGSKPGRKTC